MLVLSILIAASMILALFAAFAPTSGSAAQGGSWLPVELPRLVGALMLMM